MKSEKIRLYTIEITLIIFLLLAMIFNNIFTRSIISVILLVFMLISLKLIKSDKIPFLNTNQVTLLLGAFGVIYISSIYILGIFTGFYKSSVQLTTWSILNYIIPYIVIIISSEMIRKSILLKQAKMSKILLLIAMVILDVILFSNIYNLQSANDYFTLITFLIFSSIANNLLYNYVVTKYRGWIGIIIYRLITILYMYIIPVTPNIYIFWDTIIRILVPYIIYATLEQIYAKKEKIVTVAQRRREIVLSIILCIIVVLLVMLISCQFKYGVLTIGSGSMTGTINKGDMIVYERYGEDEQIKTGDIIVFTSGEYRIVHRIIDQRDVGTEIRYYTKGDANQQEDEEYRVEKDIVGKVKFRIKYLGYLTLWVNDIFD